MKREPLGDGWYESEEPMRAQLVAELQRIRRRTAVRPIPVLLLAAVITTLITYKIATKPRTYFAEVVLALTEGSTSTSKRSIPFDQLKTYFTQVLIPDNKLVGLIERRNISPLRKKLGNQFAVGELREQFEVEIWKNSFLYWDEEDEWARKSARIGITVMDSDPDHAVALAHDLANIAIETHDELRQKLADDLAQQMKLMRETMEERLTKVGNALLVKQTAAAQARSDGKWGIAGALEVDIAALWEEQKRLGEQLSVIRRSPEAMADQATRAGLDTSISIVDDRRPERQEQSLFMLILVTVVVATGALLGSAVFLGAFDARVHDVDDVTRLGLPVLGHVPGFAGDNVGSLEARGAVRRRVPSFLRWRSHR